MIRKFTGTTTAEIQRAIDSARHELGTTSGMVLTLLVVAELDKFDDALAACVQAGREHPSRIVLLTDGLARADRLDASVRVGEDAPGEIVTLRFHGALRQHRDSVVLPLLLPDLPVVVWWPGASPASPGSDPIGRLGTRRITDAMGDPDPIRALEVRARNYCPGDTDLTWTRLTRWRGLLAASLSAYPVVVDSAQVRSAPGNAAGQLLGAWLSDRLHLPVRVEYGGVGRGINSVALAGAEGEIRIQRTDGSLAVFSAPGLPERLVALPRRDLNTLLTEELRRLDDDLIFAESMAALVRRLDEREQQEQSR